MPAAPHPPRALVVLVGAVVLLDTGLFAAIAPLLPRLSEALELSKAEAGALAAAYPLGVVLGALPGAWVAARFGVRRATAGGLLVLAAGGLGFGVGESALALDAARLLTGLGSAAAWAGGLAWLVEATAPERRGAALGAAMSAALAGALLGPPLGGLALAAGRAPVFAAVALAAVALAWVAARMPAPAAAPAATASGLRRAGRDRRLAGGVGAIVLVGAFFGTVDVLVPLRLDELGASGGAIVATFLAAAALSSAGSPIAGRASDRVGAAPVLRVAFTGGVLLAVALPLAGSPLALAALAVASAPTVGAAWVPAMTLITGAADDAAVPQAYAVGLVNVAWAASQALSALGAGALGQLVGDGAAYAVVAAACLAGLAAAGRGRRALSSAAAG